MKYLNDYMNDKQTDAFSKHGAFFAFSNEQLNKQKKEGVKYASLGAGLIAPVSNAAALTKDLTTIYNEAVKQDISDNGVKAIIHRELANHECQITGDYDDVIDILKDYGITPEQIKTEYAPFYQNCADNNYF